MNAREKRSNSLFSHGSYFEVTRLVRHNRAQFFTFYFPGIHSYLLQGYTVKDILVKDIRMKELCSMMVNYTSRLYVMMRLVIAMQERKSGNSRGRLFAAEP